MTLDVNGVTRQVNGDPERPLLWFLRDELRLTGTKYGCGIAQCGACTVLVDGIPTRSCVLPVEAAQDNTIVTIEGVQGDEIEALRAAWSELDVAQCGYCQSGQILAAVHLLSTNPEPSDDDINDALEGNLCRCATYLRIRQGIQLAAQKLRG